MDVGVAVGEHVARVPPRQQVGVLVGEPGSTVPVTRSWPASASSAWRTSQWAGTTVSASVLATQSPLGSRPSSTVRTPSARAAPTRPCELLTTLAPRAVATSAVASVQRSSTTIT